VSSVGSFFSYTFFFAKALDEDQCIRNLAVNGAVIIGDSVGTELAIGL